MNTGLPRSAREGSDMAGYKLQSYEVFNVGLIKSDLEHPLENQAC